MGCQCVSADSTTGICENTPSKLDNRRRTDMAECECVFKKNNKKMFPLDNSIVLPLMPSFTDLLRYNDLSRGVVR